MGAFLVGVLIVAIGSFIGCTCALAFVARMKRAQAKRVARQGRIAGYAGVGR